jgi:hypothetical protein
MNLVFVGTGTEHLEIVWIYSYKTFPEHSKATRYMPRLTQRSFFKFQTSEIYIKKKGNRLQPLPTDQPLYKTTAKS